MTGKEERGEKGREGGERRERGKGEGEEGKTRERREKREEREERRERREQNPSQKSSLSPPKISGVYESASSSVWSASWGNGGRRKEQGRGMREAVSLPSSQLSEQPKLSIQTLLSFASSRGSFEKGKTLTMPKHHSSIG